MMRQRYKGKVSEIKLNSVNERIKFNSISSIGSKELTVSYCSWVPHGQNEFLYPFITSSLFVKNVKSMFKEC